jgi:hypothetical protein
VKDYLETSYVYFTKNHFDEPNEERFSVENETLIEFHFYEPNSRKSDSLFLIFQNENKIQIRLTGLKIPQQMIDSISVQELAYPEDVTLNLSVPLVNASGTKAVVISAFYSGIDAGFASIFLLEKIRGNWNITRMKNTWVQ